MDNVNGDLHGPSPVLFLSSRLDLYAPARARERYIVDRISLDNLRMFGLELGNITPFMDSRCRISTFTGVEPKHPDDKPVLYPSKPRALPIT
jgi:hypothetical protein